MKRHIVGLLGLLMFISGAILLEDGTTVINLTFPTILILAVGLLILIVYLIFEALP